MTALILTAFAPVFALVALGYTVRASGLMPRQLWTGVSALNHRVLLPAFLFVLIAQMDTARAGFNSLLAASALGSVVLLGISIAAGHILRLEQASRAPLISVSIVWNLVFALALIANLFDASAAAGAAPIVLAGATLGAIVTVWVFASSQAASTAQICKRLLTDPLIIACAAGVVVAASGRAADLAWMFEPLHLLGAGSIAVIVLSIGAGLDFQALRGKVSVLLSATLIRTVMGPAVFIALGLAFDLEREALVAMAIAGAAPGAAFTYAVASNFKADTGLMAGMLTATLIASAITLPVAAAIAYSV